VIEAARAWGGLPGEAWGKTVWVVLDAGVLPLPSRGRPFAMSRAPLVGPAAQSLQERAHADVDDRAELLLARPGPLITAGDWLTAVM
jgi:hypothetical protein